MTINNNQNSGTNGWMKALVVFTAATAAARTASAAGANQVGFYNHPGNSQFDPQDYYFNEKGSAPVPSHPHHHYLHDHDFAPGHAPHLAPAPAPWGHHKHHHRKHGAPGPAPRYEMHLENAYNGKK